MLDERQILNIITNELQNAAGGNENDFVESQRKAALAAYLGQKDTESLEDGKSSVVSTDVADAIEWIMPEVVKAFTQNNEVVTFDANYANDERQAELESQYVYDVLMKDNNGFIILHQFFKDALMQKNGFLKCFYSKDEKITKESYTGLLEQELQLLQADSGIEITGMDQREVAGMPVFDVNVTRTNIKGNYNVCVVPPEEFRVNKMHNSIDLTSSRFSAHVLLKTASELIEEGFDKDVVDQLAPSNVYQDDREYRFYMQQETVQPNRNETPDDSQREIEVSECYIHIDIDEDGVAEFMKITVAGGDTPDHILDMEEIEENPFISSTAILMSHKLFGLSIYDRLKEIQEQKTALWRNILDNMYLQNNQRTIAVEGQVNLDDLLISRPGGIIRAKRPDAVAPFPTPALAADAYKMMDYLDQVRTGRAGVSPEGPVTDSMIGDRVGSEGVERMMSQKEELVGLMIRVFAETGIKPLCYKIRRMLIKHQDVASDYKFRGDWVQVSPAEWSDRPRSTVRVGTGSGNKKEQMAGIGQILMLQEKVMQNPGQALVRENEVFNAINSFAKFSGMASASPYFLDPASQEGQQHKQQVSQQQQQAQKMEQEKEKVLAEAQAKVAEAEMQKAQAAAQNVQLKNQVDQGKNQLAAMKTQSETEVKLLQQQLAEAETALNAQGKDEELNFRYWEAKERFEVERERIAAAKQKQNQAGNNEGK